MPDPAPEALFEHVYAGPQPILDRQRDHFSQYRAGIEAGAEGGQ
jgi:pyruvate dehydrogenase E1 component alpha subunit